MKLELGQLGAGGIIEDIKAFDLPPNIFNDTLNVEFTGFVAKPMVAEVSVFPDLPETRSPLALHQGWGYGNIVYHIAACEDSVWLLYMDEWVNITPVDLTPTLNWQVFSFNGYVILSSPENYPYYVNPFDYLKPAEIVPNWPLEIKTSFLFGYSGFLIGLGLTSSDGYFDRQLIFWSDLAELGQLPANYAFSDPTSRAGFTPLSDAEDFVTAVELKNTYIIYRANSIYDMRFVGGNAVFAFERRLSNTALLGKNCVVEFDGLHFFLGKDQFYLFDGFQKTPIGKGQVSKYFYANFNKDLVDKIYVQTDSNTQTIWIYYAQAGSENVDRAYVYNYVNRLFYKRSLLGTNAYSAGIVPAADDLIAWEDLTTSWDLWEATWTITYHDDRINRFLWAVGGSIYTIPNDGIYLNAYARRLAMAYAEQDQAGTITLNRTARKMVTEVWPELSAGVVNVDFALADVYKGPYVWIGPQEFNSEVELKQDRSFSAKYFAVEFNNYAVESDPLYFELTGLALETNLTGKY